MPDNPRLHHVLGLDPLGEELLVRRHLPWRQLRLGRGLRRHGGRRLGLRCRDRRGGGLGRWRVGRLGRRGLCRDGFLAAGFLATDFLATGFLDAGALVFFLAMDDPFGWKE
jgi:hypothetical protein